MRSSNLEYSEKLDHLRLAAFLLVLVFHTYHPVFSWLVHAAGTYSYTKPANPLTIFVVDGHTGVALFLTLSGFLFARICRKGSFSLKNFYLNRFLRIYPLFILILLLAIFWGNAPNPWPSLMASLLTLQNTPNAVHIESIAHLWTISCELQFYLVFPILLWLYRCKHGLTLLLLFMGIDILALLTVWLQEGAVLSLAYSTIVGRLNQCIIGMIVGFNLEKIQARLRHPLSLLFALLLLSCLLLLFHSGGGLVLGNTQPFWIIFPSLEALAWGAVIAAYVSCKIQLPAKISRLLAAGGALSYSLYVWHFYFCLLMIRIVLPCIADKQHKIAWLLTVQDWLLAHAFFTSVAFALLIVFPPTLLVSIITYNFVEVPFFSLRQRYIFENDEEHARQTFSAPRLADAILQLKKRIAGFIKVGAVSVALIALFLLAGETFCRVVGVQKNAFLQPDERLGVCRIPNRKLEWNLEGYSNDRLSSIGLRDVEHAATRAPGTRRILILGDSMAEALQVPLEQTAARRLEHLLSDNGYCDVEVINGAHMAYSLGQTVHYYDSLARVFNPDEVFLLLDNFNCDTNFRSCNDYSCEQRPYFYVVNNILHEDTTLLPSKSACSAWRFLLRHSVLANWIIANDMRATLTSTSYSNTKKQIFAAIRSATVPRINYPTPVRSEVRDALLSFLNTVVRCRGARLTVFTMFYPQADSMRRDFAEVSALSKREHFEVVSLDDQLIKRGRESYGECHLTSCGQEVMSKTMFDCFSSCSQSIAGALNDGKPRSMERIQM